MGRQDEMHWDMFADEEPQRDRLIDDLTHEFPDLFAEDDGPRPDRPDGENPIPFELEAGPTDWGSRPL